MLVIASDNTARVWDATTGEPISPPLRHGDTVHQVWFSPDGQRLLTASADGTARVWNVPNNASSDDLILLAEVTAGRTYNTSGAFVTQKPETLYAALQNLRTKYPAQFSISAEDGLSWHRVQAVDAETSRRWPTAIWHLKHLIEKQPDSDELRRSRGIALAESGRWREAKDDFAEIVRHGTRDYHDYANLAFIHLALGEHDEYGQVCTELIDRFGNTNHALTAMDVASYCVHARNTNSSRARALAEAAVSLWPGRYYLYTLGAAYYRVGRYQDALEQFRLARSQGDGGAFYYLFEAMAQFQLGNKVEAQTLLQKAEQSIDERIGPGADEKIRSTVTWKEKLRLTLLRREAEALIAPKQIPGKELGVPGFP
jgi:tetratricopeptide (TPR) repeat protein